MKSFAIFLIIGALVMTEGAKLLRRWQTVMRSQEIAFAVQRTTEAKHQFAAANEDNENALDSYDQGSPEEREQTLLDLGLLTDKNVLCLRDPGTLDERPTACTPAQLDAAAHAERVQSGSMTLAMR